MHNRIILYIISGLIWSIVLPIILQSGYIFAIDQALNTNGWIPKLGANNYSIGWLSQVFIFFGIPVWVLEKVLVVATFTLPPLWIYLYISRFVAEKYSWALFFALSFSIFNPMLYSRFLDGQVNIYVFYALFPLFVYFTKGFFEYKTLLSSLTVWLWWLLLITTTIHASYFIFFVFLICFFSYSREIFSRKNIYAFMRGILIILMLQCLYLIPFFLDSQNKESSVVSLIERFDESQQAAFSRIPSDINIYREILSMRGYWGDYENRFIASNNLFNDDSKNDGIIFIWFLIVLWILYCYKNKTPDRNIFLGLWILGFILSLWVTNNNIFTPINALLYEYLPLYSWFREPQKFVLFLVVSYIYFWYFGLIAISHFFKHFKVQQYIAIIVLFFCSISPVLYNFNMVFWFRGQISVQQYPIEWKQAREYISENTCSECSYDTLVFPWHGYMSISWTHKVVPTWTVRYMGSKMLFGDTIEIGSVYSTSTRQESKVVEKYIWPNWVFRENAQAWEYINFIEDIQAIGIQHIILLIESDYEWYQKILNDMLENELLEIALENDMMQIYKIIHE